MTRWLLRIFVFLLLGAIVNVAVAWALSMLSNLPDRRPIYGPELVGIMNTYGLHDDPAEERAIVELKGPGRRAMCLYGDSKHHGQPPLNIRYVLQAGWPLVSLTATWSWVRDSTGSDSSLKWLEHCSGGVPTTARDALPASAPTVLRKQPRVLPLHLLWPGFAINTVFYAALLWLLFAGPFVLRRRRRIGRGLCPKCAYDLRNRPSDSTACPECGVPHGPEEEHDPHVLPLAVPQARLQGRSGVRGARRGARTVALGRAGGPSSETAATAPVEPVAAARLLLSAA